MSYKFYFGPSGSGKSTKVKLDMIQKSLENPERNYILLVPDQFTMQSQKEMVELHPRKGIMNIDVLSFSRMKNKAYDEMGNPNLITLDDTGKNLIIRKVSIDISEELQVLGRSLSKPGFVHEVKSLISEFMQYGLTVNDVDKMIDACKDDRSLQSKLADIKLIYDRFQKYKQGKYITGEESLSVLAQLLASAEFINNSVVVFDGFTGFTPVQRQVIRVLLQRCEEVWFTATVDENSLNSEYSETELFALSKETVGIIEKIAKDAGCVRLEDVMLRDNKRHRADNDISFLEKNLFRKKYASYGEKTSDIFLFSEDNPRNELRKVCRIIRHLVKEEGFAYRDIAVVTGALDVYTPYAGDIFDAYEIPYFIDAGRRLGMNPFTEYVKSGLEIIDTDFSYDSVMNLLKSGLFPISRESIYKFDNYLVALRIKGFYQYSREFARIPRYMKERIDGKMSVTQHSADLLSEINEIRKTIMDYLSPLLTVRIGRHSAKEYTSCLYDFIVKADMYYGLLSYAAYFEDNGDFSRKKEYEQIYRYFLELLDRIYELIGDDELDIKEYSEILNAGISELSVGIIPLQVDYCLLGDIERSRLDNLKILFFIGVNDSVIPKNSSEGGVISDIERECITQAGFELKPSQRSCLFTQRLYLYMNMTKPSERLYMSYSKTDSMGKSLRPSYLVEAVKKIFPNIGVLSEDEYDAMCIADARSCLSEKLCEYASSMEMEDSFFDFYAAMSKCDSDNIKKLVDGAFYQYVHNPIAKEITDLIYGENLYGSVSNFETYSKCELAYFLRYGLKLAEREEYNIENSDVGNVYHSVLEGFLAYVMQNKIDLTQYDEDAIETLLNDFFENVSTSYSDSLFFKDETSVYRLVKMKRILMKTVRMYIYQLKKTAFRPRRLEMEFKGSLKKGISILGRIDRVDTYEDKDTIYVRVVDYKSGSNELKLENVYMGVSLQLPIYLEQAVKEFRKEYGDVKNIRPAGLYYYQVQDPYTELDKPVFITEEEKHLKSALKMRLTGLSVNDDYIIEKLAGDFEAESDVVNISNSTRSKMKNRIEADNLETVMEYADAKMVEIGENILKGNIEARPYSGACDYCIFKESCGYDRRIKGYYTQKPLKCNTDIVEAMREYLSGDDGEEITDGED